MSLPAPRWTIDLTISPEAPAEPIAALPSRPGVLALLDAEDRVIALVSGADVRRLAATRLKRDDDAPSPRADLRAVCRRLRGLTAGSAFEADVAWMHMARAALPHVYEEAARRHRVWWVRADLNERFPQWARTDRPEPRPDRLIVGPFLRRRGATAFIDMLVDAFDLCRYHDVLLQAPKGQACAYKEMGRCPAPCDGTVPPDQYAGQFAASIAFAIAPIAGRDRAAEQMHEASDRLAFEKAERCRLLLERTSALPDNELRHVARLDAFAWLTVQPAERNGWCRLFIVRGGMVIPIADLTLEAIAEQAAELHTAIEQWTVEQATPDQAALDRIGVICRHMDRHADRFLPLEAAGDATRLHRVAAAALGAETADDFRISDPA